MLQKFRSRPYASALVLASALALAACNHSSSTPTSAGGGTTTPTTPSSPSSNDQAAAITKTVLAMIGGELVRVECSPAAGTIGAGVINIEGSDSSAAKTAATAIAANALFAQAFCPIAAGQPAPTVTASVSPTPITGTPTETIPTKSDSLDDLKRKGVEPPKCKESGSGASYKITCQMAKAA